MHLAEVEKSTFAALISALKEAEEELKRQVGTWSNFDRL